MLGTFLVRSCSYFRIRLAANNNRLDTLANKLGKVSKFSVLSRAMSSTNSGSISGAISSRVQLSIVGNGAGSNPVCLALTTDRQTHLFNCGEGVQRLVFEHKVKIGKIRNIYLTNVSHRNYAGLFGFLLTVAPCTNELSLCGPKSLEKVVHLYEQFMHHASNIDIRYNLFSNPTPESLPTSDLLFEDSDLSIRVVPIVSQQSPDDLSSAYLFLLKDKPGPLLIEKCKQLKIPPGPLFASLKAGNQIELPGDGGRIIRPEDVLGPCEPGPGFILLECPSKSHLDSLVNSGPILSELLDQKHLEFIVHITPTEIFEDERYQNWIREVSSKSSTAAELEQSTKHIVLNRDNRNELSLATSSVSQYKLNLIDSSIFPVLNENQIEDYRLTEESEPKDFGTSTKSNLIQNCPTLLNFQLRPVNKRGPSFNTDLCHIDRTAIGAQTQEQPEFMECLRNYREALSDVQLNSEKNGNNGDLSNEDFKSNIVFLGTGSATPGILRNTSSILVNLAEDRRILLDCGEATVLQLTRFYGRTALDSVLRSIRAVFISHIHADHHFGLVRLITERSKLSNSESNQLNPLLVIGPKQIGSFLGKYFQGQPIEGSVKPHYRFIACNSFLHESFVSKDDKGESEEKVSSDTKEEEKEEVEGLLEGLSLSSLVTVPVPHCYDSYGVVIEDCLGRKIAYSGDSMYSDSFDEAGKDCLLLIHEATMNDDLKEEAQLKRHSTISDAINVGRKIGAKYTVLTHFSQRYAKIAPINLVEDHSLSSYVREGVGIAFDFMVVRLDQIDRVVRMKSVLERLFADEIQELQDNRTKRAAKRKLIEEITLANEAMVKVAVTK